MPSTRPLVLLLALSSAVLMDVPTTAAERPVVGAGLRWATSNQAELHELGSGAAKEGAFDLPVLVRFRVAPSPRTLASFERDGLLRWRRHGDRILGATTVFLATVRPAALDRLARRTELLRVELDWRPGGRPPLDVTAPLSNADLVWPQLDDDGRPLTGEGVTIADIDTGVDVTHPALMKRQSTPLTWHDDDGAAFSGAGGEWVDMDGSGSRDAGETLAFHEPYISASYPQGNPPGFTPGLDWLYVDVDGDGRRDTAPTDGWSESSPGYGEPILTVADSDGGLESDQPLFLLGDSKVRAVRAADGTVYRRGVDLLQAPHEAISHGTPVCGILAGGEPGFTRLTGFAPAAELLVAMIEWHPEPRFWTTMPEMAAWAAAEGADVLLIEDGEWVWEFMDGSSAGEVLLTELAHDHGVAVVTASGNLAGGGQHDRRAAAGGGMATFTLDLPVVDPPIRTVWLNLNWRGGLDDIEWQIMSPVGVHTGAATDDQVEIVIAGGRLEVVTDSSVGGTHMYAFRLDVPAGLPAGDYLFTVVNRTQTDVLVDAFKWDDRSGWGGVSRFVGFSDEGTVTWPGTAHGIIVVGAFSGRDGFSTPQGSLNTFSGRGRALDGRRLVDLVAPGSVTFSATGAYSTQSLGSWRSFGGTSAALPHVAGTVALLRQAEPRAHPEVIEFALQQGARADGDTGQVPNASWGYGKLDAAAALERLRDLRGHIVIDADSSLRRGARRVGDGTP